MKERKTKAVLLEGTTEMSNKALIEFLQWALRDTSFTLTQTPRVQVAQAVRKEK